MLDLEMLGVLVSMCVFFFLFGKGDGVGLSLP